MAGQYEQMLARFCNDIVGKAREHLLNLFAIDAAIEHGDVIAREALGQLDGEPAWITCGGRACTGDAGRRGTDRDNGQRLIGPETPRGMPQRLIEADKFGRRLAFKARLLG